MSGVGLSTDVPVSGQCALAQGHVQLGPGGFVSAHRHLDVVVGGNPQSLKGRPHVLEAGIQMGVAVAAGRVDMGPGGRVPSRYQSRQAARAGVDQEGAVQGPRSQILPPRKAR